MWFCDACLTSFELDAASNDTTRINNLEKEMGNMTSRLEEMKELIMLTIPKDKAVIQENTTQQLGGDINQQNRNAGADKHQLFKNIPITSSIILELRS